MQTNRNASRIPASFPNPCSGQEMPDQVGHDGKSIFFISSRGTKDAANNIWKMSFIL